MHHRIKRGFARRRRYAHPTAVFVILVPATALLLSIAFQTHLKPMMLTYAEHEVKNAVYRTVNTQVEKALGAEGISYESFVDLEKDSDGHISAICANTARMNAFKALATDAILRESASADAVVIKIPLGNLIGNEFFAGYGPKIPIRVVPFSSVRAEYENSFTEAGVNQTRHRIMLNFTASVGMLFPGFRESTEVAVEVCVAETVIVGAVPQFYAG